MFISGILSSSAFRAEIWPTSLADHSSNFLGLLAATQAPRVPLQTMEKFLSTLSLIRHRLIHECFGMQLRDFSGIIQFHMPPGLIKKIYILSRSFCLLKHSSQHLFSNCKVTKMNQSLRIRAKFFIKRSRKIILAIDQINDQILIMTKHVIIKHYAPFTVLFLKSNCKTQSFLPCFYMPCWADQ